MSSTFTVAEYADALVAELSSAIAAVVGGDVAAVAGAAANGNGWAVTFTAGGALTGTVTAWIDRTGAGRLAQHVTSADVVPDDAVIADMLKEMWTQAAGALSLKARFARVSLAVGAPVIAGADDRALASYALTFGADAAAQIAVTASAQVTDGGHEKPAPVASSAAVEVQRAPATGNLDVVLDIDLPLVVRFGRTQMTLKTLSALGPGSILDMGRSPDEPVEILVGEQVIARGEVVIVSGNYGVRITDLVSPADRVKAMEG